MRLTLSSRSGPKTPWGVGRRGGWGAIGEAAASGGGKDGSAGCTRAWHLAYGVTQQLNHQQRVEVTSARCPQIVKMVFFWNHSVWLFCIHACNNIPIRKHSWAGGASVYSWTPTPAAWEEGWGGAGNVFYFLFKF